MRRRWLHALFTLVLMTGGLAAAPAINQAPTADRPPGSRHFVWRVSKAARPVAWLVGSVHVLKADAYPLPELFQQAFRESGVLIEEVDLGQATDPAAMMPAVTKGLLRADQSLSALLDASTYQLVEQKAAVAGVPMIVLDRLKPWMAAMTLAAPALQRAGFDPSLGIDQHFYDRAKAARRPVRGLETLAYQIDRLDGLPVQVQVEMLRAVLADVDAQVTAVADVIAAWRAGDVAALERTLLQEFRASPEVYRRLVVERNQAWLPQIAACVTETAPCLVVVGGAHLVGPDSVVALLRRSGFTVEQQ